ncbi:DNA polymerase III subunit chi [Thermomonas sp.]|jgi:DNA polymerase-3 subunit chi|uniref:DNA polymerase III subunit chi n=1 Tax=Thermomonas sp. TaxID=1971895 RepID=UPI001B55D9CC|nr:DNA polymerase III subunit chi [Thermomonas sp.]MBK6333653.1 DNA polymerase III subunit chi [Thermomonas sp.]MBK6415876.1 DNA polymerase III subunit chi [Thermomonas sp.]MBK6925439.1 DNA polymerase III subunit chi [Thermomonas sp.]MBK7205205.1 DNA polymerase III subunit chi [Thermomonas sp.]MBL0228120.1 DNA polymerase III subunit chi [Thermomonas sp.]
MPRADFYLIDKPRFREQPLLLVCELARRGYAANLPILVLARDAAQAEAIDDLLWAFDPDEYLPHQIAGMDEGDDDTPILVATPQMDVPSRALLINLRDAAPAGSFQRVLEVVPADPAARGPLRERWKHYQALGFELNKYDM